MQQILHISGADGAQITALVGACEAHALNKDIIGGFAACRRDGRFIERLGFYNPTARGGEEGLRIAQDRLAYWVGVGAQSSPTVDRLIKQASKQAA